MYFIVVHKMEHGSPSSMLSPGTNWSHYLFDDLPSLTARLTRKSRCATTIALHQLNMSFR
jgi:hypothetical protein